MECESDAGEVGRRRVRVRRETVLLERVDQGVKGSLKREMVMRTRPSVWVAGEVVAVGVTHDGPLEALAVALCCLLRPSLTPINPNSRPSLLSSCGASSLRHLCTCSCSSLVEDAADLSPSGSSKRTARVCGGSRRSHRSEMRCSSLGACSLRRGMTRNEVSTHGEMRS